MAKSYRQRSKKAKEVIDMAKRKPRTKPSGESKTPVNSSVNLEKQLASVQAQIEEITRTLNGNVSIHFRHEEHERRKALRRKEHDLYVRIKKRNEKKGS